MSTVLVALSSEMTTTPSLMLIVEALIGRGHRVVVMGADRGRASAEGLGARFVPTGAAARQPRRPDTALPGIQQVDVLLREQYIRPLEAQWELVQQVLRTEPVDVVVTDPLFLGAAALCLLPRGVERPPVVALGLFSLPFSDPEVAPYGLGLTPLDSGLNRPRNALLSFAVHSLLLHRLNRDLAGVLRRVAGVRLRTRIHELPRRADVWAHLAVPRFEYPRSRTPDNVRYLGPLPPAELGELPPWWFDDDPRPIVTVCHRPGDNPHDVVLPTIRGLADEPVRVVVTAGRDIDLVRSIVGGSPPDNLYLHRAVPYAHLMPRSRVVVGAGGWLVTQWALRWGVPLVVSGVAADQVETNARIPWLGVGVDLRTARPTPEALRTAVLQVMDDPGMRAATARIAAQIASTDAITSLCDIVEELGAEAPQSGAAVDVRTTSSIGT